MIITFPDSPYELHQPFEPAGDQPEAIDKLTEGLTDGLSFQTLLGVTGSGKTYTMANVIARTGRPALVLAPNKTLAAQLYSEFREFFPNNAVEYFVSYYDYYQPEAYVPVARPLHREGQLDQRAHRADAAVGDEGDSRAAGLHHRGDGVGDLRHRRPDRIPQHDPARAAGRQAVAARRDQAADRDAVPALGARLQARHVPRARRRARHLPGGKRRERGARLAVRRRGRVAAAVRPADGTPAAQDGALHGLPVVALRDRPAEGARRDRGDQARARRRRRSSSSGR